MQDLKCKTPCLLLCLVFLLSVFGLSLIAKHICGKPSSETQSMERNRQLSNADREMDYSCSTLTVKQQTILTVLAATAMTSGYVGFLDSC